MGSSQDERPVNFLAFCLAYFEALICGMCAIHEMSMNMLCCAGKYAKVGRNDKKKGCPHPDTFVEFRMR